MERLLNVCPQFFPNTHHPQQRHLTLLPPHNMRSCSAASSALRIIRSPSSAARRLSSTPPVPHLSHCLSEIYAARRVIAQDIRIRKQTIGSFDTTLPLRRLYISTRSSDDPQIKVRKTDGVLSKTGLHELHVRHGGKMVPFAGYSMPVQYDDLSVGESHKWTRERCSLFDVGHMYTPPILSIVRVIY